MFGQFEHPFVKLPKVQDPLPPPIRYVFGEKFHGETIGLLEARFHAPLEETLDPWLGDFEPTKGDLAELRATLTSLRAKAIAHAESAVVDPSAELMRDLRIAREAYDEAKRSGDEMAKRDARAMISRTYSLGMKKLREVAFGAMTSVVATSYKPDVGYGAVEKVAKQLATEAAMPPEGVGDVVRAAAKRHMLRRGVLAVAGEEVDEIVLRQRPSCAAYLAFD